MYCKKSQRSQDTKFPQSAAALIVRYCLNYSILSRVCKRCRFRSQPAEPLRKCTAAANAFRRNAVFMENLLSADTKTVLLHTQENRLAAQNAAIPHLPLSRRLHSVFHSASSRTARTAMSTSSSVLKNAKLNRTAPCSTVPSASCIRGAQCAPARVAMPQSSNSASATSPEA